MGASAAAELVEDMRGDRLVPDVPVASALICAYGVLGQFHNAERMLLAAEAAVRAAQATSADALSKKPDARLYTEFLIASCRCARPDAAARVFGTSTSAHHVRARRDQGVRRVRHVAEGGGSTCS